jgi:hypothetical protein
LDDDPGVVDPEVPERAKRRRFTAEYKARILAEYEDAGPAERGALLRREGLYGSYLAEWRKAAGRGALDALASKPRGRKGPDAKDCKIAKLEADNQRLRDELATRDKVIEVPGKVSGVLVGPLQERGGRAEVDAVIDPAVGELALLIGTKAACAALGRARATHYRHLARKPSPGEVTERRRAAQPRALSPAERAGVLEVLHSDRFVDESPATVYATLLDEGRYLVSPATMYRLLRQNHGAVVERRRQATHPPRSRPELVAEEPNDVWSWDITRLRGPAKREFFYLYVLLDLYSRFVVGWMLTTVERAELARRLITETIAKWGIDPTALTIHSDNGVPAAKAWHATAARLRREAPISHVALPDYPAFWAVTKHADVMEIGKHPEVFTNAPTPVLGPTADLPDDPAAAPAVNTLIQMDGEVHRNHRNLVGDWFEPGNVKRRAERVEELARHFVDRMQAMGERCDFANDIAVHYPLQVILSILGLPEEDHQRMLRLTQELFGAEDPDIGRVDASVLEVIMDFVAYFDALARDRRQHPTDDLASVIANGTIDGEPLPDMDVFGFYLIVATAGHDTTSNSIAGGLLALLEHPDQLALLQSDPTLVDNAADELIRHVSPVKPFLRTCREPFTLRDVPFQPGELTLLSYASANRDEEVFDDPFRLDVRRSIASSHLAFGFGRHSCLGAHLARLEVRAIFQELLARIESIELDGEPTFVQARLVSGPKTLPVRGGWR